MESKHCFKGAISAQWVFIQVQTEMVHGEVRLDLKNFVDTLFSLCHHKLSMSDLGVLYPKDLRRLNCGNAVLLSLQPLKQRNDCVSLTALIAAHSVSENRMSKMQRGVSQTCHRRKHRAFLMTPKQGLDGS